MLAKNSNFIMSKDTVLSSVDDISNDIASVGISDNDDIHGSCSTDSNTTEICANCGKAGASNTCNKCKLVKYCNASCKKKHRSKHKKDCEDHIKRAAALNEEEMRRATELHDLELFKLPPLQEEDCPICFQRLPWVGTGKRYQSCCGKFICTGCIYAMDNELCPFCRAQTPSSNEENIKRLKKLVELNDANAMSNLAGYYSRGMLGLSQDHSKALELWKRAAEHGCGQAYHNIGVAYHLGEGVKIDEKKAIHYYEQGAMRGCVASRYNLGTFENNAGNTERALRHYMISVADGHHNSLKQIQQLYSQRRATKDDYTKALRSYQKYLGEVKSSQRDEAAAASDEHKYLGGLI